MGDKAQLLQAMNDAVAGLKKGSEQEQASLIRDRQVNDLVARDLKSDKQDVKSVHSGVLKSRMAESTKSAKKADTLSMRSVRSEYDYASKRKFIDVLSQSKSPDTKKLKLSEAKFDTHSHRKDASIRSIT